MRSITRKNIEFLILLKAIIHRNVLFLAIAFAFFWMNQRVWARNMNRRRFSLLDRIPGQVKHLREMVDLSDDDCKDMLRMDRRAFARLCHILSNVGGLKNSKHVTVKEKVAMFLYILAHHTKNRAVKFQFKRSGQTISKHFHGVLQSVIKLHSLFLQKPLPVPDDSTDPRWGKFKGCLGALDGTYIDVLVPTVDKGRYRNRKGHVSVNVLGVCDMNMRFVYVLTGWEGSAADSRVLRDAINRNHGLKVPRGNYYLCDNGYPNCEGFLTPYKGVRYHLSEWSTRRPQTSQEYFNMKHTRARNVIERTFGLLKMRWGILRSPSWYPVKTHNQIIMACSLIHNFIRSEMDVDPIEHGLEDFMSNQDSQEGPQPVEIIDSLESSPEWSLWRDNMAKTMFNEWNLAN
ncbi:hypothetical protein ACS0TY_008074 [Phlomoides rotata]